MRWARRRFLQVVAARMGARGSAQTALAPGCKVFSPHQPRTIDAIAERINPKAVAFFPTPKSSITSGEESLSKDKAKSGRSEKLWLYYLLFFISGFPALLYQIVWQRALFSIYGVNVESVTVIVTVFMLGLGLGSLAGGKLSARPGLPLLLTFGSIELGIGAYGALSMSVFHWVASFTAGAPLAKTGLLTFALLLVPTLLMGSTLPLLVAHLVGRTRNVGESVGSLYAVNTLGSGAACLAAALFVMRELGESGSVRLAALLNLVVGGTALLLQIYRRHSDNCPAQPAEPFSGAQRREIIPFGLGLILAAAVGFISLAYEIIWYRLYSFTSGGAASSFAKLLAFYLFGIAYGSFAVRDVCRQKLKNDLQLTIRAASNVVALGSVAAYLLGPVVSVLAVHNIDFTLPLVFVAAALMGSAFPILSHAAIDPRQQAGKKLSYLYLSNIVGSALGSFLVGFVIMDRWSTRATSLLLLGLGLSVAFALNGLARPPRSRGVFAATCTASVFLALLSGTLFSSIYERLLFKGSYKSGAKFNNLVENRSGVIAVDSKETVYGGGVYDGRFNTDLVNDSNGIFRAYAIAGLHPKPQEVLIIGLSSGSWAQVVANHPQVEAVTIVEINPGYLSLIQQRPSVSSLLRNPKVRIVIDDGRRWLLRNPDRKFDFILMNTSFHWRAHMSNLLSIEFLRLIRSHLKPGGIEYYNTTWSGEVQATGSAEFPYALRIANFLAVSDSPISLDRSLWRNVLMRYTIDGRPVLDLANPTHRARLDEVINLPDVAHEEKEMPGISTESRASMLNRLNGLRLITDDNMGTEWR